MRLFDTHCHLDLYPDYRGVIDEIERARIYTIAVTNAPSVFRRSSQIAEGTQFVRTAIGLHPELVGQRYGELGLFTELLGETSYVGEVGLDFVSRNQRDRDLQKKVFRIILERCADQGDKFITVHSRRAAGDVVDMVGSAYPGTVVLHWFSGSSKVLERALENGLLFSVNPAMLASEKGRQLIAKIPLDRLLTETDGPFVRVGDNSARPRDVAAVVSRLAELKNLDPDKVAEALFDNFRDALTPEHRPRLQWVQT
ncbi:Qat anti-phage system TatD family nuclease QatD [Rubrobacter indicoceani]|uniref:Qat anti-phage system TatD family nuclease QatD n=1 Tax=Rubrobacter indicoceani TaxID=2051957 RepID=UPI000E5BB64A|nr:Qat anti-phage system TatD family nuclease QatD [Rubrobacter indicoceani]